MTGRWWGKLAMVAGTAAALSLALAGCHSDDRRSAGQVPVQQTEPAKPAAPEAQPERRPAQEPPPASRPVAPKVTPPVAPLAWRTLPPTPVLPAPVAEGVLPIHGAGLYYARFGTGEPVILLHGGMGNSRYWGSQVVALAPHYDVIVMDSRGHGRSAPLAGPISYEIMAEDVAGLMDRLAIPRAAIVGWSDGAIAGLILALRHPERVSRLFAFGANFDHSGLIAGGSRTPVFSEYMARTAGEYRALSPRPGGYGALLEAMNRMWQSEPNIPRAQLATLHVPALIVDGEHDEIIQRRHTEALAAAIGSARLRIEPGVSHFAMLQNPAQFNADLLAFLGGE